MARPKKLKSGSTPKKPKPKTKKVKAKPQRDEEREVRIVMEIVVMPMTRKSARWAGTAISKRS